MAYWLMKSEPTTYGIAHLKKDKIEPWDGVRNYQARNMMRDDMKKGDLAFMYHSNCTPPGIAGIMEIHKTSYPDHTAFDPDSKYFDPKSSPEKPRWFMVDVKFKRQFNTLITLDALRNHPELHDLLILRKGNRLSITPLTQKQWDVILTLE